MGPYITWRWSQLHGARSAEKLHAGSGHKCGLCCYPRRWLVFAWGRPESGGDSSAAQHQLKSAKHVQATSEAFAAILEDGFAVTWSNPACGGDQLSNVQQVQVNKGAFAGILKYGSIMT